jgi:amidase
VDAGGTDMNGVKRSLGGNPQTGPFYITGAMPGDVLVVHIKKLTLNRDWAESDDGLDERALNSDLAVKVKENGKSIRWQLDRSAGTATPEAPAEHLKHYAIPLKPMLGCISAAPGTAQAPPGTGDSGYYGGNMDFNEIRKGATVYLRVANPGALLYFGDAHAAQGDGELNGNALETSMDVELTVDVIPNKRIGDLAWRRPPTSSRWDLTVHSMTLSKKPQAIWLRGSKKTTSLRLQRLRRCLELPLNTMSVKLLTGMRV